ncbi:MAG: hypothetical protein Q4F76_07230 [Lachnospiraceae bacterium]|nr:hypothetical protein [Lachnospiraceae bacterium]
MPYCPKCDMEFIEGITICSDCGGPLYESEEAWNAARKKEREAALRQGTGPDQNVFPASDEAGRQQAEAAGAAEPEGFGQRSKGELPISTVYVKKSERYEDMKSSASAFLLMGCAALAAALLCIAGILPISGTTQIIFSLVLAVMGLVCLIVCIKTRKEAAVMQKEAAEETAATEKLITWFLRAHSADAIDQKLAEEALAAGDDLREYTPEELSLKRYGLIQDYLITEKDLPDQTYVDLLCEEIYNRMFGQE